MFTVLEQSKYHAVDKDGRSLADPSASSAEARKRAVLRSLSLKAFKPLEWAATQKECREKIGPMRVVKKTTYTAMGDGKPIAEPRDNQVDAKADVAKAIGKAPKDKAPRSTEGARTPKKEGET